MRTFLALISALVCLSSGPASAKTFEQMFPGRTIEDLAASKILQGFDYQQGAIKLLGTDVTLTVPAGFYFLDWSAAPKVLVDLWAIRPAPPRARPA